METTSDMETMTREDVEMEMKKDSEWKEEKNKEDVEVKKDMEMEDRDDVEVKEEETKEEEVKKDVEMEEEVAKEAVEVEEEETKEEKNKEDVEVKEEKSKEDLEVKEEEKNKEDVEVKKGMELEEIAKEDVEVKEAKNKEDVEVKEEEKNKEDVEVKKEETEEEKHKEHVEMEMKKNTKIRVGKIKEDAEDDLPPSPYEVLQQISEEAVRVASEAIQNVYNGTNNGTESPVARVGHRRVRSEVVRTDAEPAGPQRSNSFQKWKSQMQKAFQKGGDKEDRLKTSFNPEVLANQKRQWYQLHSKKLDLSVYKETTSMFEDFVVVGLSSDANLKLVEEAFAKRKTWELQLARTDIYDMRLLQARGPSYPSMEPQVLFQYPPEKQLAVHQRELPAFCFPEGVKARLMERTPSMSDLNGVIHGQEHLGRDDLSFIFSLKGSDNATLYGVCLHVQEIVQRSPRIIDVASPLFRSAGGLSPFLISAPRCYCVLTRVPFFELHYEMLNSIVTQDRLNRITQFINEMNITDHVPSQDAAKDGVNDNSHSHIKKQVTDWKAFAIPVNSAAALTAAAAGIISDDEVDSFSFRSRESETPESISISEASDISKAKETDRSQTKETESSQAKETERRAEENDKGQAKETGRNQAKDTVMSETSERDISQTNETDMSQAKEMGMSQIEETDMSEAEETDVSRTKETDMTGTKETDTSEAKETDISEPKELGTSEAKTKEKDMSGSKTEEADTSESKTEETDMGQTTEAVTSEAKETDTSETIETDMSRTKETDMSRAKETDTGQAEKTDASQANETDMESRKRVQFFVDASEMLGTHCDDFERSGGYANGHLSPERDQSFVKCPGSCGSIFSSVRSMGLEDGDDDVSSVCDKNAEDGAMLKWAKEHKNELLQIVCCYHALPLPPYGAEIVFQPLEHLQAIKYSRPAMSSLELYGFSPDINLRDSIGAAEVNVRLAAAEEAFSLSIWTTATVCRVLSLESILALFAGVLLEKQVVVVCPNLGVLSSIVLSLIPMIHPFEWQSLLLPVLPKKLLEFLDAPVPFIVGIQHRPSDMKMKTSNLIHVDVDMDKVRTCNLPPLPRYKEFLAELGPIHARLSCENYVAKKHPVYQCNEVQTEAAEQFLSVTRRYLESLCSDLRSHTITSVQSNSDKVSLLFKDSFVDSFSTKDRPFVKLFVDTQLFSVLSDSRLSTFEHE